MCYQLPLGGVQTMQYPGFVEKQDCGIAGKCNPIETFQMFYISQTFRLENIWPVNAFDPA